MDYCNAPMFILQ